MIAETNKKRRRLERERKDHNQVSQIVRLITFVLLLIW